ncbi:lysine histidine transporter-like 8 protein [Tanacetum coccineum]
MEVLTLMLQRRVRDSDTFTYHHNCSNLNIINLCFADDLNLLAHGDVNFVRVIMEALEEFKDASGLVPSLHKSTSYFCNVLNYIKLAILNVIPFEEGKFPVKYLGVPLVSSKLIYRDCKELVEKVKSRINDWKDKFLSFASEYAKTDYGAKVGLRRMLDIPLRGNMSWGWRKILQVRALIRHFIWYRLGAGNMVSAWFDRWCSLSPLSQLVTPRDIHTGFNMSSKKLETQDKMRQWDVSSNTNLNVLECPLCERQPDSHDHLFFECIFSLQVWNQMKRSVRSVIVKLVFAASCYYIWQERNYRLFKNEKRSEDQVIEVIKSNWWMSSDPMALGSVYDFGYILRVECQTIVVLFFPSPRFFPLGFSWEGFLNRQSQMASYSPSLQIWDTYGDSCALKWFFPTGVIVSVFG